MFEIAGMLANAGMNLISSFVDKGKDKAVDLIKEKTGIDLNNTKELNQDQINKLKQFETENKKLILDKMELLLKDRQNAREMQIQALQQDSWFAKNFTNLFAAFWSVLSGFYIVFVTFYAIPPANQRFADTILGFLMGTIIASIIGYYYGSSLGSKEKDKKLIEKK